MSLFEKLDREQLALLNQAIYPRVPEEYDLETLQVTDMIVENMISPFASLVIDRVASWLEGEEKTLLRKARLPWQGDDQVAVERVSPINGVVACVVSERATERSWRLNWKDEYGTPVVTVENREADGSFRLIARAKARHAQPTLMRDVNGWLRRDGLDSLIELSMLMASKMPKNFRSGWKGLQRQDRAELPLIRNLLAADGGMPGPVSRAYLSIMHSITFDGHAKWAYSRLGELVAHLNGMGAVWGEAVMEYGYDSTCTVPTPDGSVALFHDNSSTCGDERSYIAKFERDVDGQPSRLSIFPIGQEEQTAPAVEAFIAGTATPAFTFNFAAGVQTFGVPNRSEDAMNAFRMWMTKDIDIGIKLGTLDTGFPLFEVEEEEDDIVPAPTGPKV